MTARMVAAIEHPLVDVIGHPTGRKIETRAPYAVDMEQVIEAAARTHTMLEINAAPDRRDLNEIHARAAAEAGVLIVIDSDAHSARNLELMRYGIATARRAWLTPAQVANTRPWAELRRCASGAAPRHERAGVPRRRARRRCRSRSPAGCSPRRSACSRATSACPAGRRSLMSVIVFAGSAQIAALTIIGARRRARLGDRRRGADELALPADGHRDRPVAARAARSRAPRRGRRSSTRRWALASDGEGGFDRHVLFGSSAIQYVGVGHAARSSACSPGRRSATRATLGLDAIYPAFFLALLIARGAQRPRARRRRRGRADRARAHPDRARPACRSSSPRSRRCSGCSARSSA